MVEVKRYGSLNFSMILIWLIMLGMNHLHGQINLNDGLRAHFNFNDNVLEQSGSGEDGVLNGAFLVEDRFGNCEYSLGFDAYLQLMSMPSSIINGLSDIALSAWFKTEESGVFISAANSSRPNEFLVQILDDGRLSSNIRNIHNVPGVPIFGNTNVRDNQWHHVVLNRNGVTGETVIYLDGVLDGGGFMPAGDLRVDSNGFFLGNDQDCLSGCWNTNQQFLGALDDVRIYDRQLTLDEIEFLRDIDESQNYPALELGTNIETCDRTITLDAGPGFDSYLWSTGETSQSIQVSNSGTYSVTSTFLACEFNDDIDVAFEVTNPLTLSYQTTVLHCNETILIEASEGFDGYLWSNGEVGRSINVSSAGTYSVTASNFCGEVTSNNVIITSFQEANFSIANAFSPNEDGTNDVFELPEELRGRHLKIFDRWGKLVYESESYHNTWRAKNVAEGTYFYSINSPCQTKLIKGWVQILR